MTYKSKSFIKEKTEVGFGDFPKTCRVVRTFCNSNTCTYSIEL